MIAFFLPSIAAAREVGRRFASVSMEIDGPFRLYLGRWQGHESRAYVVGGGADAGYAAARMAARRGAKTLIPMVEAIAHAAFLEEHELELGQIARVGDVWDFLALAPLLQLLPETASELPQPLEPHLPEKPVLAAGDSDLPACGTFPWVCRNRALFSALRRSTGCRIFNLQMAGYASAAAEEGLAFAGLAQLTEAVSKRGLLRTTGFDFDEALDASLTGVLGGIRTPHPG